MKKLLILLALAGGVGKAYAQCKIDYSNYHLVLDEGFEELQSALYPYGDINKLDDPSDPQGRGVWQFQHDEPEWGWGDEDYHNLYNTPSHFGEYYRKSQVSIIPDPGNPSNRLLRLTAKRIQSPTATPPFSLTCSVYDAGPPTHAPVIRYPQFISGMIQLKRDVFTSPPANCPHTFDHGTASADEGYIKGMFEIRMKISKKYGVFPAFWLIGPTQFNIYEGKDNPYEFMQQYDNEMTGTGESRLIQKRNSYDNLGDDFHTYTGVWTDDKITFFLDGRETYTTNSSLVSSLQRDDNGNYNQSANSIIASHQIWYYSSLGKIEGGGYDYNEEVYMDIDYIRVYKPNDNPITHRPDYSLPYKTANEFVNTDALEINPGSPGLAPTFASHSIVTDPNDPTSIFHVGMDGRLYKRTMLTGPGWGTAQPISANHTLQNAEKINGDIIRDITGKLIYRGADQRMQYYYFDPVNHYWFQAYIDDFFSTSAYLVAKNDGSLVDHTSSNDIMYYIGDDKKIQFFGPGPANFNKIHGWIDGSQSGTRLATNSILLDWDGVNDNLIYRGADERLQMYKKIGSSYVWIGIDPSTNPTSQKVKDIPRAAINGDHNEVFYIGQDDKIHRYYFAGSSWQHQLVAASTGYGITNPSGYVNADFAREGITYDPTARRVFYFGYDGRLQYFQDMGGSNWIHFWADDYWNSERYQTYNSSTSTSLPPSLVYDDNTARAYYVGNFQTNYIDWPQFNVDNFRHIRYFEKGNCENLNPSTNPIIAKREEEDNKLMENKSFFRNYIPLQSSTWPEDKKYHQSNTLSSFETKFSEQGSSKPIVGIYPNPSETGLFNIVTQAKIKELTMYDMKGSVIKMNVQNNTLDLSHFSNGIYMLVIQTENGVENHRLVLNKQ